MQEAMLGLTIYPACRDHGLYMCKMKLLEEDKLLKQNPGASLGPCVNVMEMHILVIGDCLHTKKGTALLFYPRQ